MMANTTAVTAEAIASTFHFLLRKLDEREATLSLNWTADCLRASALAWCILVGSPGVQSSLASMGCSTKSSLLYEDELQETGACALSQRECLGWGPV